MGKGGKEFLYPHSNHLIPQQKIQLMLVQPMLLEFFQAFPSPYYCWLFFLS
jgi:hypothetical protein